MQNSPRTFSRAEEAIALNCTQISIVTQTIGFLYGKARRKGKDSKTMLCPDNLVRSNKKAGEKRKCG